MMAWRNLSFELVIIKASVGILTVHVSALASHIHFPRYDHEGWLGRYNC